MRPWHRGRASTSNPNVLLRSSAHGRYGLRRATSATSSTHDAEDADARFGERRDRSLLAEPSTPAYRTVWKRGGGTDAQSRPSSESGSRSTATVPSENAFLRPMRTRPSGPRVTRSCATAGRRMYSSSASRPSSSSPPARVAVRSDLAETVEQRRERLRLVAREHAALRFELGAFDGKTRRDCRSAVLLGEHLGVVEGSAVEAHLVEGEPRIGVCVAVSAEAQPLGDPRHRIRG